MKRLADLLARRDRPVTAFLRDDDAIQPGPQLDRLLALSERYQIPSLWPSSRSR